MAEAGEGEKKMSERQPHRARDSVSEKISRVRESRSRKENLRDVLSMVGKMREAGGGMPTPEEMGGEAAEPFGAGFRNDLIRRWHLLDEPDSEKTAKVQERIDRFLESNDPYQILSARKEHDEFINTLTFKQKEQFEKVIDQEQKDLMLAKVSVIERNAKSLIGKFAAEDVLRGDEDRDEDALTNRELEARVKDIRDRAVYELGAIRSRWHSVEQAQALIISTARSKLDYKGEEGLRAWIAFEEIRKIQEAAQIHERFQVKTDPIENIQTAEEVMRFFEQSKSPETFRIASQQLTELQQVVVNSNDTRVSEEMKTRFRKRTEAFITVNTLIFASISNEGNPTALHKIALEQFNDETWEYYFSRFTPDSLKDKEGNLYLKGENGKPVEVNIVGEALNVFAEQYMEDRYRMNIIERFSEDGIKPGKLSEVEKETLIQLLTSMKENKDLLINPSFKTILDKLDLSNLEKSVQDIDTIWSDNNGQLIAIRGWYERNTLLGADRYEDISTGEDDNKRNISILRKDKWQERVITEKLRERLLKLGVREERVTKLMGSVIDFNERLFLMGSEKENQEKFEENIGDFELLSAIKRNGYELAKLFYSDSLDRIRVFGVNEKTEEFGHENSIFGEDTPYLARVISHLMDFAIAEKQGDERVNRLVMKLLDDNSGSILLPQNLTAVRVLFQRNGMLLDKEIQEHMDNKYKAVIKKDKITQTMDVNGFVISDFLRTGLNPNRDKEKPGTKEEVEDERIREKITEIKWGDFSKEMKSFEVHDMYDDRQKAFKWYMEKFRIWTLHPTDKELFSMLEEYYSMRNPRRHPGTEQYLEMYWYVGQHWKDWFGYRDNLTDAHFEAYIQRAQEHSWIDEKRADRLRNSKLGREPFRAAKQFGIFGGASIKETLLRPGWWSGNVIEFFKALMAYLSK